MNHDALASEHEVPVIRQAVLKVVGPCNLNCSYCYVYNQEDQSWRQRPKFIAEDVFLAVVQALRRYCDRHDCTMAITYHGGEPTMLGPTRLDRLATIARDVLGERLASAILQTNGVLIDDAIIDVLRAHEIVPGVSLDGPPEVHDAARVDHAGRGSYEKAVRGLRRLQDAGLNPGVLAVIQPGASGVDVYRHLRSLGVSRMDFLLPDVSHDNKQSRYGHLGRTPVADYFIPILHEWMNENDDDVFIGNLWDLFRLLLGGACRTDAFTNPAMTYVVVETDGSVEALDALRVCEEGIARTGVNLQDGELEDVMRASPLVRRMLTEGLPLCATCEACPERNVCGGGYLPHRYARANGFDNPSVWCEDLQALIAAMRSYVREHQPA